MEKYKESIAPNPLFEMIHISMDDTVEDATKWAAKDSFPWLTILPEASAEGLYSLYPDEGVPEYMLVDSEGKIILVAPGEAVFAKIKELSSREKEGSETPKEKE